MPAQAGTILLNTDVMAGLVPAIHVGVTRPISQGPTNVDARNKSGHDELCLA
jgi:hypothetical protein